MAKNDNTEKELFQRLVEASNIELTQQEWIDEYQRSMRSLIGYCVTAFSQLDQCTDELFTLLSVKHGMNARPASLVALNLPLRSKCTSILCLAHEAELKPKMMKRLVTIINQIQGDLRNRRNRLLHDTWDTNQLEILRRKRSEIHIKTPQAFTYALDIPEHQVVTQNELSGFTEDCLGVYIEINKIIKELSRHWEIKQPEVQA